MAGVDPERVSVRPVVSATVSLLLIEPSTLPSVSAFRERGVTRSRSGPLCRSPVVAESPRAEYHVCAWSDGVGGVGEPQPEHVSPFDSSLSPSLGRSQWVGIHPHDLKLESETNPLSLGRNLVGRSFLSSSSSRET